MKNIPTWTALLLLVHSSSFAMEGKPPEEPLGPGLRDAPIDVRKYILSFLTEEKERAKAAAELFGTGEVKQITQISQAAHQAVLDRKLLSTVISISAAARVGHSAYSLDPIDKLLEQGANVNAKHPKGNTPLMFAARGGDINLVARLLEQPGIDPTITNDAGKTARDFAEEQEKNTINPVKKAQYQKIIARLEDPNPGINYQTSDGDTALMTAAHYGEVKKVKRLLEHPKIDHELQNKNKQTAMDIARENLTKPSWGTEPDYLDIITLLGDYSDKMAERAKKRQKTSSGKEEME